MNYFAIVLFTLNRGHSGSLWKTTENNVSFKFTGILSSHVCMYVSVWKCNRMICGKNIVEIRSELFTDTYYFLCLPFCIYVLCVIVCSNIKIGFILTLVVFIVLICCSKYTACYKIINSRKIKKSFCGMLLVRCLYS